MVAFSREADVVGPEPSPPLESLGAWWRADDAGTVDSADVTSWADRTAYGQTLVTLGGVTAPTWQSSVEALGNRPAVRFVENSGLALSTPPGFMSGANALTVYVVLASDTLSNVAFFGYGALANANAGNNFSAITLVGPDRIGNSIYGGSALAPTTTGAKIYSARAATSAQWGNSHLTIDGAIPAGLSYANPTIQLAIPSPVQSVSVGGFDGAYDFRGRLAEVLYYSKDQSPAEIAQTLAYLSNRYGISVT